MDLGLRDSVVVVTGAAGAIGSATTRLFVDEGAVVVLVDRDRDGLARVAATLPEDRHLCIAAELSSQSAAEHVVAEAETHFGQVNVVTHLAALLAPAEVGDVTEEDFSLHLDVNVKATFFLVRAAAESMKSRSIRGRVLIMSSGAWLSGGWQAGSRTRPPKAL